MALTQELLRELELTEEAAQRILAAHAEETASLRQAVDGIREEYAAYKAQAEAAQHREARRAAIAEALEKQGANPAAIPLLTESLRLPEDAWDGDTLIDPAALHPLMKKHPGLYARRTAMPILKVQPPVDVGGTLTPADVMRMSAEDINRNWSAVRTALQNR